MKVRYIGMFESVLAPEIADAGGSIEVKRRAVVEVPDELGERLLAQSTEWEQAKSPRGGRGDAEDA